MKIAIIGATGFIGRQLVKKCIEEEIYTVCIDKNSFPDRYKYLLESEFVKYIKGEINNKIFSEDLEGVDSVVCLAAVRPTPKFGLDEYMINLNIATETMKWCLSNNVYNAVFISSRSVYSNDNIPWKEEQKNIALNLYGEAKAAVDNLVNFYNIKNNTRFKSLRLAQVIGIEEKKGYLLNTLIDNANQKKESVIYGSGQGRRQYIYIQDVVNAILHSCKMKDIGGVFNIGMPGNVSIAELAKEIYDVFENSGNYRFDLDLPEDKKSYEMSLENMENILKFIPKYNLRLSLQEIKKEIELCK